MNKIDKINKYALLFNEKAQFRKEAAAPVAAVGLVANPLVGAILTGLTIYGLASMVSGWSNQVIQASVKVEEVKSDIQGMIDLIELQRKDGFGKFGKVFEDWESSAKKTISLMDDMLKPPSNEQDLTQIQKATEFIEAAQNTMYSASAVKGALLQLKDWTSSIGGALHTFSLNFISLTRLDAFTAYEARISSSLSSLIKNIELKLKELKEKVKAKEESQNKSPEKEKTSNIEDIGGIKL